MSDYNEQFSLLRQCVSLVSIEKDRLEISCRSIFTIANVPMDMPLTRQTEFSRYTVSIVENMLRQRNDIKNVNEVLNDIFP